MSSPPGPFSCFQSAKQGWMMGWMWTHMPSMAWPFWMRYACSWLEWRSCMHMPSLVTKIVGTTFKCEQDWQFFNAWERITSFHSNAFLLSSSFIHLVIFKLYSWLIPRPPPCSPASGSASIVPMVVAAISSWTFAMAPIPGHQKRSGKR